jgi:hypothetical protein
MSIRLNPHLHLNQALSPHLSLNLIHQYIHFRSLLELLHQPELSLSLCKLLDLQVTLLFNP